jgi:hypothetical protein
MIRQQQAGEDEPLVRRYDYEDGWTIAVDLGVADDRIGVDLVDRTAIVLVDGRTEAEIDLPGTGGTAGTKNGVLVLRGER